MIEENSTDPKWARNNKGRFHRLLFLSPDAEGLSGVSGIYILWHGGLKPEWITVGKSHNLGRDLDALLDDDNIQYYENRGGVYVAWSTIRDEYQDGVLQYLIKTLDLLEPPTRKPAPKVKPIAVYPPGLEPA